MLDCLLGSPGLRQVAVVLNRHAGVGVAELLGERFETGRKSTE